LKADSIETSSVHLKEMNDVLFLKVNQGIIEIWPVSPRAKFDFTNFINGQEDRSIFESIHNHTPSHTHTHRIPVDLN